MTEIKLDEKDIAEINRKLTESLENYRKTMQYMYGDAPIGVMCLPKATETALTNAGILRIYDLFNRDLVEIKGIGAARIGDLTTRLNEFLSMC